MNFMMTVISLFHVIIQVFQLLVKTDLTRHSLSNLVIEQSVYNNNNLFIYSAFFNMLGDQKRIKKNKNKKIKNLG